MAERVEQEKKAISRQTQFRFSSISGLSLIEVMVVMVILVLVVSTSLPQFQNKNQRFKSLIRRFLVLGNKIRHNARLKNQIHRLVIDLGDEEEGEKREQSYWVELSSSPFALAPQNYERNEKTEEEEEGEKKEPLFSPANTILKKPINWPKTVKFESVEFPGQKEPILYNEVYIYFFPSGSIQEAAVHLMLNERTKKTFYFNSTTGEIKEFNKKIPLESILDR